jgi:adenylate cyclase
MSARTKPPRKSKPSKKRGKSSLLAFLGGLLVALTVFMPSLANSLLSADRTLGDKALNIPGDPPPLEDLVFLGIDEDSMTLQGLGEDLIASDESLSRMAERFPWDRRVYANALEKLFQAGARLVVIDLVFSEQSDPEADAELARVFQKYADKIIIASVLAPTAIDSGAGFALLEPHPIFANLEPAPRFGYANFRPDQNDGLVREAHYSTTLSEENGYKPIPGEPRLKSLAGAVVEALGKPEPPPHAYIRFSLEEGVPVEQDDGTLGKAPTNNATHVYAPLSMRSVFIPDDWEHRYESGKFFKDKIILIGPGVARLQDNHQTPVGQIFGPQLHLQAIASALKTNFAYRPFGEWRGWIFWTALLGAGAAAALLRWVHRPLIALALTVLVIGAAFAAAWLYARWGATWLGPTPFAAALFVGAVTGQSYDLISERLERSRLHHQFRRFVSRDVADSLVNDPSIYQLAAKGRKRRVVVMFSDIRGFTSLSEQVSPEQLFGQLNEYFTAMVKIIFNHKGTLDKFIGDAILAHWGALDDGTDSAFSSNALTATQEMTTELEKLNEGWKAKNQPVLQIGIGLHIGEVLAGEIGSEQRTEFGVIGDAVNLASRLEGMTKAFTCPWLASGQFIEATGSKDRLRRIATVRVKGREEPVELWTTPWCEASRKSYAEILEKFEAGNFEEALRDMESYLATYPDDAVAVHLRDHIAHFNEVRPPDWDGIIRFKEK